jgi:hypothetical protein
MTRAWKNKGDAKAIRVKREKEIKCIEYIKEMKEGNDG